MDYRDYPRWVPCYFYRVPTSNRHLFRPFWSGQRYLPDQMMICLFEGKRYLGFAEDGICYGIYQHLKVREVETYGSDEKGRAAAKKRLEKAVKMILFALNLPSCEWPNRKLYRKEFLWEPYYVDTCSASNSSSDDFSSGEDVSDFSSDED